MEHGRDSLLYLIGALCRRLQPRTGWRRHTRGQPYMIPSLRPRLGPGPIDDPWHAQRRYGQPK